MYNSAIVGGILCVIGAVFFIVSVVGLLDYHTYTERVKLWRAFVVGIFFTVLGVVIVVVGNGL